MSDPQTSDQCPKQALFLEHVTPNQSSWIAFGTMIPMVVFTVIIVLVTASSGGKPFSQQTHRFLGSTLLLVVMAALTFLLNMAFMHMQYCGPASPELAVVGMLSIWTGDIAALGTLIAWVCGAIHLFKAWRIERQRRTDLRARGRIDI